MPSAMIAGNWKMNTNLEQGKELASGIMDALEVPDNVETVICPPFISLAAISELLAGSKIKLGAQNVYPESSGAFTGETSPSMLSGICQYVILGHSERRQYFGETYVFVNKKVKAVLDAGMKPILCVGEDLEDKESGRAETVVSEQLAQGLSGVDSAETLVIAYEPIWAIGTGQAATPEVAQAMMSRIRDVLTGKYGKSRAGAIPLLYGGSCNAENVSDFIQQNDINGALVGGASLSARSFADIVLNTSTALIRIN